MCRLPKIGSSSWVAAYSRAALRDQNMKPWHLDHRPMEALRASHGAPGAFTAVFLRDPLERFISGYLDKCANWRVALAEKHCEPHVLHCNGTRSGLLRDMISTSFVEGSLTAGATSRAALELYADTVPLKWNGHFMPQALSCDELGLTLPRYSFVGVLNAT